MRFHITLLQLEANAEMFVLVCLLDADSPPTQGGAIAMAFSLQKRPWKKSATSLTRE